mgnify:CR=1 FL=1
MEDKGQVEGQAKGQAEGQVEGQAEGHSVSIPQLFLVTLLQNELTYFFSAFKLHHVLEKLRECWLVSIAYPSTGDYTQQNCQSETTLCM